MAVTFAYRSHYDNPGCRYVRRFNADTVLDWFRSIWTPIAPTESPPFLAYEHAERLIGRDVYSFSGLFEKIAEYGWPPPATIRELTDRLEQALYVNELKVGPHHVQVLTDDDELEMGIYVFDDHYVAKHPDRVAFLTRDGWELPDGAADGSFRSTVRCPKAPKKLRGEGATFYIALAAYDSGGLTDLSNCPQHGRIDGVRLPDLPRYLFAVAGEEEPASELNLLVQGLGHFASAAKGEEKAFLKAVRANPHDDAAWGAYSDWLEERDHPPAGVRVTAELLRRCPPDPETKAGNRREDLVLARRHVAQACKQYGDGRQPEYSQFHHLILFDDLWAAAHPVLANSVLRFASRWDVL